MTVSLLTSCLTYSAIMSFTPGPNNIMALSSSTQYGVRRSVPFLAGMCAGLSAMMLSCAVFTLSLARLLPDIMGWLTFVGAAYILWLAWRILTSPMAQSAHSAQPLGFWAGFFLQFVNVKMILYGLTALSTFVLPYTESTILVVGGSLALACVGWVANWSWAFAGHVLQAKFRSHGRLINAVLAALLVYCVVRMFC